MRLLFLRLVLPEFISFIPEVLTMAYVKTINFCSVSENLYSDTRFDLKFIVFFIMSI